MLPFLKPKTKDSAVMIQERKPDSDTPPKHSDGILAAAQDLIDSVHSKDKEGVAAAFKAAFELLELEPHDEVSHSDSE